MKISTFNYNGIEYYPVDELTKLTGIKDKQTFERKAISINKKKGESERKVAIVALNGTGRKGFEKNDLIEVLNSFNLSSKRLQENQKLNIAQLKKYLGGDLVNSTKTLPKESSVELKVENKKSTEHGQLKSKVENSVQLSSKVESNSSTGLSTVKKNESPVELKKTTLSPVEKSSVQLNSTKTLPKESSVELKVENKKSTERVVEKEDKKENMPKKGFWEWIGSFLFSVSNIPTTQIFIFLLAQTAIVLQAKVIGVVVLKLQIVEDGNWVFGFLIGLVLEEVALAMAVNNRDNGFLSNLYLIIFFVLGLIIEGFYYGLYEDSVQYQVVRWVLASLLPFAIFSFSHIYLQMRKKRDKEKDRSIEKVVEISKKLGLLKLAKEKKDKDQFEKATKALIRMLPKKKNIRESTHQSQTLKNIMHKFFVENDDFYEVEIKIRQLIG